MAAYLFGRSSFDVWLRHNVFWWNPGDESTWHCVPLAVEQLRSQRLILAADIHPNVFSELRGVFVDLEIMAEVLVAAWKQAGKYGGRELGTRVVPESQHWVDLRTLADRASDSDHPLRSLDDFGAAVGEYHLRL